METLRYGIIGKGFIYGRHVKAIKAIGGVVEWTCDKDESKGADFLYYKTALENPVDYVVICTPNYLHYEMILEARKKGYKVICEKPLCIKEDHFQHLLELDDINIVLQLREKKWELLDRVDMKIHIHRDEWYFKSWKNNVDKSGGLLFNIGIHYFDLLTYLYGRVDEFTVEEEGEKYASGTIKMCVPVKWSIRLDAPRDEQIRVLTDGKRIVPLVGFEDLHTRVYESILRGKGTQPKDIIETMKMLNYAIEVRS